MRADLGFMGGVAWGAPAGARMGAWRGILCRVVRWAARIAGHGARQLRRLLTVAGAGGAGWLPRYSALTSGWTRVAVYASATEAADRFPGRGVTAESATHVDGGATSNSKYGLAPSRGPAKGRVVSAPQSPRGSSQEDRASGGLILAPQTRFGGSLTDSVEQRPAHSTLAGRLRTAVCSNAPLCRSVGTALPIGAPAHRHGVASGRTQVAGASSCTFRNNA